jgi:copper binding plastocyanin/azurin family protein
MKQGNGYATAILMVFLVALAGAPSLAIFVYAKPEPPREIRLVARDMTFFVDGQDEPNPTLRLKRGEHVRIVLRNDDTGLTHDVSIRPWQVEIGPLQGKGEKAASFRVPDARGEMTYECTPHAQMMRGSIVVE